MYHTQTHADRLEPQTETVGTVEARETRMQAFTGLPAFRVVATLAGSALLVMAAFVEWTGGTAGNRFYVDVFYRAQPHLAIDFWRSAGAVLVGIAVASLVGLATLSGWITRLAGSLALVLFALVLAQLIGANAELPQSIGSGLWLMLLGGSILVFGGVSVSRPLPTEEGRP